MVVGDPLSVLADPTPDELEVWLTQRIQDEFGTYAPLLRGLAWAKLGAFARARCDLDSALAKQPAYELVELISALIAYVTRDYQRSLSLLDKVAANHKYLAAQTLRVLEARATRLGWITEQRRASERLTALGVRDLRAHIHGLQRARADIDPRQPDAAARRLWALHEHLPEQLGAELDALLERAPEASLARTLRARLHLRLGRLDEAALALAYELPEALPERWALLLARGRAVEVAAAELPNSTSVRAALLRAEALLELDQLDAAARLLERAVQRCPRGSAWAELARVRLEARAHGRGPDRERFAAIHALAPGLLSDAARELELEIWIDGGLLDDSDALLRCCEHAWTMLTPDRDSRLWYRTRAGDGELRLRCNPGPEQRAGAHDEDAKDLDQAARLLRRALEKRGGAVARNTSSRRELQPEQIERFLADGYVHLRGAFPRKLADAVVRGAHRRMREEPERWVQGERKHELVELLQRGYDPDDPQTWPEGRVDLLGDRRFAIHEFSPYCDHAIMQLLGGPSRVRTHSWANNLIIQYRTHAPPDRIAPEPDWHSWHLDSPSVDTRLDNLQTGLLVFVLFGDLEPRSGNTWLALDSPAKVARALAANPEGMDFCELDTAPKISAHCERLFEVTGEAGDILLVHPLMLHSASVNPSPRIRWMGNPMIYTEGPLDHRRRDASPVERLIADALRG